MPIRVADVDLRVLNMRARLPFKYGITTLTALPHLLVRVELHVDNRRQHGFAADHLPPKWFTKNPDTDARYDLEEMIKVIDGARLIAKAAPSSPTVFDLWRRIYDAQAAWAGGWTYPPLLAHFGTSLMERAIIDAYCRATGTTFGRAIRDGSLGVKLGQVHPELEGAAPADFLPAEPLRSVALRHTIGLADPLTDADVLPGERVDDGLPQSLDACIGAYGLNYFKIKLVGDVARDVERVRRIADAIERNVAAGTTSADYHHTLDFNENFKAVEPLRQFWSQLTADPALGAFLSKLILVEQPLHRDVALGDAVRADLLRWTDRPPIIIDESDGELKTSRRALDCGYAGTSHKNCKGVFKGLANACLIAHRRRADPAGRYVISSEDLCNIGPVAQMQDACAAANFGITHVERNGHHYFRGLSMWPADMQDAVLAAHPDMFRRHERGYATLRVEGGRFQTGSVVDAPFGVGFRPDVEPFTPLDSWSYESLERDAGA